MPCERYCFSFQGQASDIDLHAREVLQTRDRLNALLARHTGQPLKRIQKDTDRDHFMSGDEAIEYGLIDTVLSQRGDTEKPSEATG